MLPHLPSPFHCRRGDYLFHENPVSTFHPSRHDSLRTDQPTRRLRESHGGKLGVEGYRVADAEKVWIFCGAEGKIEGLWLRRWNTSWWWYRRGRCKLPVGERGKPRGKGTGGGLGDGGRARGMALVGRALLCGLGMERREWWGRWETFGNSLGTMERRQLSGLDTTKLCNVLFNVLELLLLAMASTSEGGKSSSNLQRSTFKFVHKSLGISSRLHAFFRRIVPNPRGQRKWEHICNAAQGAFPRTFQTSPPFNGARSKLSNPFPCDDAPTGSHHWRAEETKAEDYTYIRGR